MPTLIAKELGDGEVVVEEFGDGNVVLFQELRDGDIVFLEELGDSIVQEFSDCHIILCLSQELSNRNVILEEFGHGGIKVCSNGILQELSY